ncbi:MAG: helix-turn-helix transcriptional regulator [Eubacterium sp.]|jgi:transcriptional regulator with XRE-family HTH domain|nr:helix-turn-helix transcriptional regulator [Eubacterium sp.]
MKGLDYAGIGMRIRAARKARGLSQDKLAAECGVSLSFIGHIERGTRSMSLETFVNICRILNADADGLLWGVTRSSSESVKGMWNLLDGNQKKTGRRTERGAAGAKTDSYEMYVKIMKSVAEIMNEG